MSFIETLIEEDISKGFLKERLKFRFPPEPNGHLHIGHAKAICLNFGLGVCHKIPVVLRFDDTNPINEKTDFIEFIKKDIQWLGFQWSEAAYTSDYFQQLYDWAVILIKQGDAYVDSQSSQDIAIQKGTPTKFGVNSPYRSRPIEKSLDLFSKMRKGEYPKGTHVLRAKIDMTSQNMLMRDPLMYRILSETHHRTGKDWHIYPLYDWAHGQSDYIENISHSFCTLEFAMHRELYDWFLDKIIRPSPKKITRPKQREFARLNMSYTIMSKRKLAQLVQKKVVSSWDDPRMPTLSGMRRRGYPPEAIKKFCDLVGVAKRENLIDLSLLEFCVRDYLNKVATRMMVVLDPVKIIITNYPKEQEEWLQAENNPESPEKTYRKVPFSRELYIEKDDFREEASRKFFRLKLGGEVRLKNAYIIKANTVKKNDEGRILEIHCTYDTLSKSGSGTTESLRKVKGTLHWVSINHVVKATVNIYDRLFNQATPESHPDGFMSCLNDQSLKVAEAYMEPSLLKAKSGEHYQFQRLGYFHVDDLSTPQAIIVNKTVGLRDTWASQNKN